MRIVFYRQIPGPKFIVYEPVLIIGQQRLVSQVIPTDMRIFSHFGTVIQSLTAVNGCTQP